MGKQLERMDEMLKEGASNTDIAGHPNRPSKKSKTFASADDDRFVVSNALIFAAIERIERLQEETLKRTQSLENTE